MSCLLCEGRISRNKKCLMPFLNLQVVIKTTLFTFLYYQNTQKQEQLFLTSFSVSGKTPPWNKSLRNVPASGTGAVCHQTGKSSLLTVMCRNKPNVSLLCRLSIFTDHSCPGKFPSEIKRVRCFLVFSTLQTWGNHDLSESWKFKINQELIL